VNQRGLGEAPMASPRLDAVDSSIESHELEPSQEPIPPKGALQVNPGSMWRRNDCEPGMEEVIASFHREMMQRFDQQEQLLLELTTLTKKPQFASPMPEVRSEVGSVATSGPSGAGSGAGSLEYGRRKNEKKPTLFSTFTQFDLSKRRTAMNAEEGFNSEALSDESPRDPFIKRMVEHPYFDVAFSVVVITNSIFIGVDVQMNPSALEPRPLSIQVVQYAYTALFTLELILRLSAHGSAFFCSADWMWGLLDLFIVMTSIWEVFVDTWYALSDGPQNMESLGGVSGLKAFRIVRITRIVKTVRLMRVFRFVLALRTLIHSIIHTLKSLFWALVLLALIVYVFALIFTQAVHGHMDEESSNQMSDEDLQNAQRYYGSLSVTMFSLFMSVTDGVSWENVSAPLGAISFVWMGLFLFYVSFTYFAVLNVLTAVFCQSAIESAQNDHATAVQSMIANREAHLAKVRALFQQLGNDEHSVITFRQFEEKINSSEVKEYFETLGLDVWDAWGFFKLLDRDGGGSVEIEEFLKGCLRFRGQAKAIDVGQVMHDQAWLIKNQGRFHTFMETELGKLKKQISTLSACFSNNVELVRSAKSDRSPKVNRVLEKELQEQQIA